MTDSKRTIRITWDDVNGYDEGWSVECRIDGHPEWVVWTPGEDQSTPRDADRDVLLTMAVATVAYHEGIDLCDCDCKLEVVQ